MIDLPKLHVVVLMGGWANERPVSLMSGEGVAKALEERGHKVTRIDMDRQVAARPGQGDVEAARSEVFAAMNSATALRHAMERSAAPIFVVFFALHPIENWMGVPFEKPVARMRETVDVVLLDLGLGSMALPRACGGDGATLEAVKLAEEKLGGPVGRLHYLSVPPVAAPAVIQTLREADLVDRSRVVMEKPFGTDLRSAIILNDQVHETFHERQIFRIDHFLGKEAAQNILAFRFANGLFDITVLSGTSVANPFVHNGSTGGPASRSPACCRAR